MKQKKAFTLIELLVVIAIIGVIATISIIALQNARAKSRDAKRVGDAKQIQTALELFFNDNNRYPTAEEFALGSIFLHLPMVPQRTCKLFPRPQLQPMAPALQAKIPSTINRPRLVIPIRSLSV